ncbi:MAG: hypothetical protein ACRETK_08630, partial [Steroidobacteraceae bacterium]
TPMRMLITVALLAVYCALACWIAITQRSWAFGVVTIVAVVACIGTAMLRPWSRFLVYLLTAALVVTWLHSLYVAYDAGVFRLFSPRQNMRLLAPDGVLMLLSCYCSYAVFRQFVRTEG